MSPGTGATFITLAPEECQRWIDLNRPLVEEWLEESDALGQGDVSRKIYNDLLTGNSVADTGE